MLAGLTADEIAAIDEAGAKGPPSVVSAALYAAKNKLSSKRHIFVGTLLLQLAAWAFIRGRFIYGMVLLLQLVAYGLTVAKC